MCLKCLFNHYFSRKTLNCKSVVVALNAIIKSNSPDCIEIYSRGKGLMDSTSHTPSRIASGNMGNIEITNSLIIALSPYAYSVEIIIFRIPKTFNKISSYPVKMVIMLSSECILMRGRKLPIM